MKQGDILITKDTHEVVHFYGAFDDNSSIVIQKDGTHAVLPNACLQVDYERMVIRYITNKIKTLWTRKN